MAKNPTAPAPEGTPKSGSPTPAAAEPETAKAPPKKKVGRKIEGRPPGSGACRTPTKAQWKLATASREEADAIRKKATEK